MNPVIVGFLLLVAGVLFRTCKFGKSVLAAGVLWLFLWSTGLMTALIGMPLEREVQAKTSSEYSTCDAIVDLGGGVGISEIKGLPELHESADRAYFSSRLWKDGKAPIVIPSNPDADRSDARFLVDLGIPTNAIWCEPLAKNTEQNAKFVQRILLGIVAREGGVDDCVTGKADGEVFVEGLKPRILLVTSAWHMKRSSQMFEKYASGLDVVPAPCDFVCPTSWAEFEMGWFLPSAEALMWNTVLAHEWAGYWWYKYMRSNR